MQQDILYLKHRSQEDRAEISTRHSAFMLIPKIIIWIRPLRAIRCLVGSTFQEFVEGQG